MVNPFSMSSIDSAPESPAGSRMTSDELAEYIRTHGFAGPNRRGTGIVENATMQSQTAIPPVSQQWRPPGVLGQIAQHIRPQSQSNVYGRFGGFFPQKNMSISGGNVQLQTQASPTQQPQPLDALLMEREFADRYNRAEPGMVY